MRAASRIRRPGSSACKGGGAARVGTELGEDPPGLQVCGAVFDGGASAGQDPVGLLLARGELTSAGGLVAGVVGQGQGMQAVAVVLARVVGAVVRARRDAATRTALGLVLLRICRGRRRSAGLPPTRHGSPLPGSSFCAPPQARRGAEETAHRLPPLNHRPPRPSPAPLSQPRPGRLHTDRLIHDLHFKRAAHFVALGWAWCRSIVCRRGGTHAGRCSRVRLRWR